MSVTPNVLQPPNHKYQTVVATPTASGDVVDVQLGSATSNEPDDGADDGDTVNDIVIVDDLDVNLRAERSGVGSGQIYALTWQATNSCRATVTATATVPSRRDRRSASRGSGLHDICCARAVLGQDRLRHHWNAPTRSRVLAAASST